LLLELETLPVQKMEAGDISVADVLLAYRLHADQHYRGPDGKPTSGIYAIKIVIKAIRELYAEMPVSKLGPLCVIAARQKWVNEGCSRKECNRRVGVVKRILKWAVSMQLAPVDVYQAIATISGLKRGRTKAPELAPIGPVEDSVVEATLPFLNRHIRGLIELQRLTGCRPGEACSIRQCEIDTRSAVWIYRPTHHKTSHRGKSRTIAIGPRAQTLLREFFTPAIEDYLFSPVRALNEVRGTPLKAMFKMRAKKRAPKERYNRTSYTRAIARAAVAAQVEHWHPNQLRHAHATKVRKAFGLEHAGAALGHAKMSATEIYAERDAGLALEVAAKLG
jgi:integrase